MMTHTCHATDCTTAVPPEMWGCKKHWFMVPKALRDAIWRTYRVGQCDDLNPSREYLTVARAAVVSVAKSEGIRADTTLYDHFLAGLGKETSS